MIKTRIAGTAAVFTFGLASLGGAVVAIAAPANAAPANEHAAGPSEPSGQAHLDPKYRRTQTQFDPWFHAVSSGPPDPWRQAEANHKRLKPTSTVGSTPTSGLSATSANRPVERNPKQRADAQAKRHKER